MAERLYETEIESLIKRCKYLEQDKLPSIKANIRNIKRNLAEISYDPSLVGKAQEKMVSLQNEVRETELEIKKTRSQIAHYRRKRREETSERILKEYHKSVAPSMRNLLKWRKVLRVRITGEKRIKELERHLKDLKAYREELQAKEDFLKDKYRSYSTYLSRRPPADVKPPIRKKINEFYKDYDTIKADRKEVERDIKETEEEIKKRKESFRYQVGEWHKKTNAILARVENLSLLSEAKKRAIRKINERYVEDVNDSYEQLKLQVKTLEQHSAPSAPSPLLTKVRGLLARTDRSMGTMEEFFSTAENRGIAPELYSSFIEYKKLKKKQEKKFLPKAREFKGVQKEFIEEDLEIAMAAREMIKTHRDMMRTLEKITWDKENFYDSEGNLQVTEEDVLEMKKKKINLIEGEIKKYEQMKKEVKDSNMSQKDKDKAIETINWGLSRIKQRLSLHKGEFEKLTDLNKNIKEIEAERQYAYIAEIRTLPKSRIAYDRRRLREIEEMEELRRLIKKSGDDIEKLRKKVADKKKAWQAMKKMQRDQKRDINKLKSLIFQARKSRGL